nr:outer membrane lipoprotein-sorting protein [Granulicella arctica]
MPLLPLSACGVFAFSGPTHAYAAPAALAAEDDPAGFGPLDPTPPTGLTPQQIIEKFGARESAFNTARENYTFRQSVKVDTISEDTNKVDGEYYQVTDITFNRDGRREEHVVFAPQNSLERVIMSPADFADIEHRLPFVLTTEDLPQYDITYLGRQKIDEIDTYVFQAGPKVLEKNKRYFQGKVWVDQQDFQIVLINGKSVPDDKRKGHEDLSPPFTTYYEQVDGKYWFPTYTKAEGTLHFSGGNGYMSQDVHMRTIVKYTDYKQFHATSRIIYNGEDITNQSEPQTRTPPPPK